MSGMTPDTLLQCVSLVIRRHRERLKHTQEGFAALAGVDRAYYGQVERGKQNLTLRNLQRIALALGVPASRLLRQSEGLDLNRARQVKPRPPRVGRPAGSSRYR
jgi:transcriptional regulator with XRE-family HTH domain